jgi:hypothetical protein
VNIDVLTVLEMLQSFVVGQIAFFTALGILIFIFKEFVQAGFEVFATILLRSRV